MKGGSNWELPRFPIRGGALPNENDLFNSKTTFWFLPLQRIIFCFQSLIEFRFVLSSPLPLFQTLNLRLSYNSLALSTMGGTWLRPIVKPPPPIERFPRPAIGWGVAKIEQPLARMPWHLKLKRPPIPRLPSPNSSQSSSVRGIPCSILAEGFLLGVFCVFCFCFFPSCFLILSCFLGNFLFF